MTTECDIILDRLLERYGTLYSCELGLDLGRNTPSILFRWLCAVHLMSARISHETALQAARALSEAGWTTPEKMAASAWKDRVKVLNTSGYARYDESTSRMLGENAEYLVEKYGGDLRVFREETGKNPGLQRERLKTFKGIGDVGADIFFREMQGVWPEHFPLLDDKARDAARRLGLPTEARALSERVGRAEFPRLVTALVRAELSDASRKRLLAEPEELAS